ncbi:MAG: response regulator, partial [Planctomycetota bacterium]
EVREALAGILTVLGFRVLKAGNGKEGLEILEREGPDLVFCDLVMPDKDGLEVCREIRKKAPGIKVLAMSGAVHGPQYLKVASMLGSEHSLQKPLRKTEIVEAVLAVLGRG